MEMKKAVAFALLLMSVSICGFTAEAQAAKSTADSAKDSVCGFLHNANPFNWTFFKEKADAYNARKAAVKK